MHGAGTIVRIFSAQSADLVAQASNAGAYAHAHPNIPPYEPWPAPPAGFRIRAYDLDVPPKEGRFGRIWRCSSLMVNVLPLEPGRGMSRAFRRTTMMISSRARSPFRGRSPTTSAGRGRRTSGTGGAMTTRSVQPRPWQ